MTLPELVTALLEPRAYPEPVRRVELAQTQMSFVFLTDDYVYKIKKPVDLGYLDYTTLEKRRYFCRREVELNRRLCADAYLGVEAITRDKGGIRLNGTGETVEYAVKMRRLPRERMMDVLLANDGVSPEMAAGVARKMAEFHRRAETGAAISAFGSIDAVKTNTDENFTQTEKYIGNTISREKYRRLKSYTDEFINRNATLFDRRVKGGRIRDCHGDLHAAHVCFADGICIYDCIEFNDRFRYCDIASEIAFLAMDLDHYGRADLSRRFVSAYLENAGDNELKQLLTFYKCYRAYVRGKVESFKLDDPYIGEKERIRDAAAGYFDLASFYTRQKPALFITVGLVGTGKTTLAQALAKRLGLVVISSDVTRKRLAGIPPTERRLDRFDSGIYSAGFTRTTYDALFAEAGDVLNDGGSVIIDASFIKAGERLRARELAEKAGAGFMIIECTLDEESIRQRLEQRLKIGSPSDGRWEIFQPQKELFEPVVEAPPQNYAIIDGSKPLGESIRQILDKIGEQ